MNTIDEVTSSIVFIFRKYFIHNPSVVVGLEKFRSYACDDIRQSVVHVMGSVPKLLISQETLEAFHDGLAADLHAARKRL